jgi:hypothetical protein
LSTNACANGRPGAGTEIQAIINRAFDVDSQARINRGDLLGLLRLEDRSTRAGSTQ